MSIVDEDESGSGAAAIVPVLSAQSSALHDTLVDVCASGLPVVTTAGASESAQAPLSSSAPLSEAWHADISPGPDSGILSEPEAAEQSSPKPSGPRVRRGSHRVCPPFLPCGA